jgi:1,4-dihydroxy-2-naphthoyl-CoA hydrolase
MFSYKTSVHLRDTDATGVLYFAEQFKMALEAFEAYLKMAGLPLGQIIQTSQFLMPIVHATADYMAPLRVGDNLEIFPKLERLGTSSFTVSYRFQKGKDEVGKVSLVHVTVSKETLKSIPLPQELHSLLQNLGK